PWRTTIWPSPWRINSASPMRSHIINTHSAWIPTSPTRISTSHVSSVASGGARKPRSTWRSISSLPGSEPGEVGGMEQRAPKVGSATQVVAIIGGATAGAEAAGMFADRGAIAVVFEQNARPYGKVEDGLPRWHAKLR